MRWLSLSLIFVSASGWAVAPVVTPATPVVNQGATLQFSETQSEAGTWACSATNSTGGVTACSGSINSGTGLYTAPSSVTAQHVYGGVQIGPNNDVFNTRIDTLPINANNTLYLNTANLFGTGPSYATDFPMNFVLPTGSTSSLHFHYTPLNNGAFEVPAFPNARAEHGWFSALQNTSQDHHVIMVDTVTGNFSEFYQFYPNCVTTAASVTGNIASLTCTENPTTNEFLVGSSVTVGGFTGADTYFNVTNTSVTAVTSTSISFALSHANASASTNGSASKNTSDATGLFNSASGIVYGSMTYVLPTNNTTDAAGMELQPMILGLQELEQAVASGGEIKHAMRNTFALGIEASSSTWPATTFAVDPGTIPFGARMRLDATVDESTYTAIGKVLIKQLKHYGTINSDGGINWTMNGEFTRWPKAYYDALSEISNANLGPRMQFVDSSGMMVSTFSSLTKYNREQITFTRTSDSAQASVDIALMGPAVNFAKDQMNIMAGTPAQQLTVLNNYGGFTCTMNPSTGTLTSGCLYTPPANLFVATTTIITATSIVNSSAAAQMTLTVFPSTGIYVIPSKTADYVDTKGNTWSSRAGLTYTPDNQGCCACDNSGSFSGGDVALWNCVVGVSSSFPMDTHLDFTVPNGTYQVIYHYGTQNAIGSQFIKYSVGSSEISSNLDPSASAGGQFKLFTSTNTTVTNNQLQTAVWTMNDQGAPVSSLSVVLISSGSVVNPTSRTLNGSCTITGNATVQ